MKKNLVLIAIAFGLINFVGCGAEKKPNSEQATAVLRSNVKITADAANEKLILGALWILQERTPDFFRLVDENVLEIRKSDGSFTTGPVKTIEGTGRIEFKNFAGVHSEYNIADFLVHEATHIADQKKGLRLSKAAEIRAREAEIKFFEELERVEKRSFASMIKFVENEIHQIKAGQLYADLD